MFRSRVGARALRSTAQTLKATSQCICTLRDLTRRRCKGRKSSARICWGMSENNTSGSKRIHPPSEWNLILMDMVPTRTTIHMVAEITTAVAIRMVAAGVGTATRASRETTTDHPILLLLQHRDHLGRQPHQQIMQLSTLSTMVQGQIRLQHTVDTKTIWRIINTMLSSRHNSRVKHPLHQLAVKVLLLLRRRHQVLEVLRRRHQVDRTMAPCRLHQDCRRVLLWRQPLFRMVKANAPRTDRER